MKKLLFLLIMAITANVASGQTDAKFNPAVYTKPLPRIITVANQPSDFKMTTHLVNIKVPADSVKKWGGLMEQRYIKRLFNVVKDVDCLILNYSGFYYNDGTSEYSIERGFSFEVNHQNKIKNIGLSSYDNSSFLNSEKLLQITTLSEDMALHPQIVTHELFHQWNSFLESANYWLIDPSHHTGLVEDDNSVFYGHYSDLQHVSDSIYSVRQGYCTGFPGKLEGYLAGLWDMPDELKTLKNYWFYNNLPRVNNNDGSQTVQVKADSLVVVNKSRLFNLYGGERIPNYINSKKDFDCAVVVFTIDDFLSDDKLKGFHYTSILNEFEGTAAEYNNLYDQVCIAGTAYTNPDYGTRETNPYHSSFKKLHFHTRLFNDDGTVDLLPNPAREITGIMDISRGAYDITNVVYSTPEIKNATSYIWTLPNGAVGTSTTNSISVTFSTAAISGFISVKGHNSLGDGDLSMQKITFDPLPANAGIISGITAVTKGASNVVYTVPEIKNATSYIWTLPSGATGSSSTNSITVNYGPSAQSGIITVKGNNLLGDGKSSSVAITIDPLPANAGRITGTQVVCKGASNVVYSVAEIKYATSYIWTFPSGATGTSTTNSIAVDFGTTVLSGDISVRGHNSSGDGKSSSLAITIDTLPAKAGSIAGLSTVDQGQDLVVYSVPSIENATSYIWSLPDGATGTSITNSISVYWGTSAKSGNITVKGTNCFGEGASSSLQVTVNSITANLFPADAGLITGPISVCQGTFATYTVPPIPNATSYTWTFPDGRVIYGAINKVTVYHPINALSGDITVRGTNSFGNGISSTLALTVNSFPVEAGPITGPTNVSIGQKSVKYTVTPIANATSYVWSLNNIQIGTSATNTILINYDQGRHSGDLSVNGQNSCGEGWSSSLAIIVNSLPEIAGNITGPTVICKGKSTIYSVPPIRNATSYDWTLPSGATGTSATNSITVNFNSSAISGDITVKGTNSTGKGVASSLKINVTTAPLISFSGNVLHSNVSTGNQWYNQNGIINGATSQSYSALFTGDYYAIQTLDGCSSEASNILHVVVSGIGEIKNDKAIKVYPNPFTNELIIEIDGNNEKQDFEILNTIGQVVFKGSIIEKTTVRTGNFVPGIYLIKLKNGKYFEFKKIKKG